MRDYKQLEIKQFKPLRLALFVVIGLIILTSIMGFIL